MLLQLSYYCLVLPFLPLATVRVSGLQSLERSEILRVAGINEESSLVSLSPKAIASSIKALVEVESVQVSRRFPDGLLIEVKERNPIANILSCSGGEARLLSIDAEGYIIREENIQAGLNSARLNNLPLISGLVIPEKAKGLRLPVFLLPFTRALSRLASEDPLLLRELSEVEILPNDGQNYELVLLPVRKAVRFKTGAQLNRESLTYMMLILDVLDANTIQTDEFDLRTSVVASVLKGEAHAQ